MAAQERETWGDARGDIHLKLRVGRACSVYPELQGEGCENNAVVAAQRQKMREAPPMPAQHGASFAWLRAELTLVDDYGVFLQLARFRASDSTPGATLPEPTPEGLREALRSLDPNVATSRVRVGNTDAVRAVLRGPEGAGVMYMLLADTSGFIVSFSGSPQHAADIEHFADRTMETLVAKPRKLPESEGLGFVIVYYGAKGVGFAIILGLLYWVFTWFRDRRA
jgi:hypothetical protein